MDVSVRYIECFSQATKLPTIVKHSNNKALDANLFLSESPTYL